MDQATALAALSHQVGALATQLDAARREIGALRHENDRLRAAAAGVPHKPAAPGGWAVGSPTHVAAVNGYLAAPKYAPAPAAAPRPPSPQTVPPTPRNGSPQRPSPLALAAAADDALWRDVESGRRLLLRTVKAQFPHLEDAQVAGLAATMVRRPPGREAAAPGPEVATYLRADVERLCDARDERDPKWNEVTSGARLTRGSIRHLYPKLTEEDVAALPTALARKPRTSGRPAKDVPTYLRTDVHALAEQLGCAPPPGPRPPSPKKRRAAAADVLSLLAEAAGAQ